MRTHRDLSDQLNRLSGISSVRNQAPAPGSVVFPFNYQYNTANQRQRLDSGDGSYWLFGYDKLGQVNSAKRYWSDGTPVAGQQFEYTFDDIGNRTSTKAGGDASGQSLRPANYSANALNQYTSRDVPGTNDIIGMANAAWTVTVNGSSTYRHGEYYQKALSIANSSLAAYPLVTVVGSQGGNSQT